MFGESEFWAAARSQSEGSRPTPAFRDLLAEPGAFVRVVELVTTRGLLTEPSAAKTVSLAMEIAESGIAHALSITDNAGGHPKIAPESLGSMLLERGEQVIIHLTCKDLNRNGLESRAWTLANAGFENLLCLTGDHPVDGYMGQPGAVFDLDSVALLHMLHEMNQGLRVVKPRRGEPDRLPPTNLFLGAAVSPFKRHERELIPQLLKLEAKLKNGAQFIITQTGYDSRKLDELRRYLALRAGDGRWGIGDGKGEGRRVKGEEGVREGESTRVRDSSPITHHSSLTQDSGPSTQDQEAIPHPPSPISLIANVCVLTPFLARHFNKGAVPGLVVSDELLELAERHSASPDKGKAFFHELASKQIAIARGLGYQGAYFTGHMAVSEIQAIFERADSYGSDDWLDFAREIQFPQHGEFYYFERDPETGLSSAEVNREYQESITPKGRATLRARAALAYKFSRLVHQEVFDPESPGFSLGRWFYSKLEKHPIAGRWVHAGEQASKIGIFDCRDCGDCSLPDIAYLCPESQCAKNQRNGPCGGSHNGVCEHADRDCIWARAYDRLKPYGEELEMLDRPPVYIEGGLRGTSAWSNTFLGRDHHAARRVKREG